MTMREVLLAIEGLEQQNEITDDIYRRMTFIVSLSGFNGNLLSKDKAKNG